MALRERRKKTSCKTLGKELVRKSLLFVTCTRSSSSRGTGRESPSGKIGRHAPPGCFLCDINSTSPNNTRIKELVSLLLFVIAVQPNSVQQFTELVALGLKSVQEFKN
ncbi:hypothetical protein DMN91_005968 [Ooceraea biroi]|uniref:Uncharacterized protein n=1 Tax=Ooceraea biroi TaxID=2015173 RepID=A0A3L8DMC4_OOCBI|nr:hypothetical protein DMN91_005968 [Ooceraea biroi]